MAAALWTVQSDLAPHLVDLVLLSPSQVTRIY